MSGIVLVFYWVLLAFLGLAAASITLALTAGEVKGGPLPTWGVAVLSYGAPVVIGWRIWVIARARRIAALAETFGTEGKDV